MTARTPLDLEKVETLLAMLSGASLADRDILNHNLAAEAPKLVAEIKDLRRDLAANEDSEDARLAIAEAEVARLRQANEQLRSDLAAERAKAWKVATLKCWTNEDDKRFVFVADLQEALGVPTDGPGEQS